MSNSTKSKSTSSTKQTKQTKQTATKSMAKKSEQMKYEVAEEFGVKLGADATARQNGSVGGEITRRLVKLAQGNTNEKE